MRKHLICFLAALGLVAVYGLAATSDVDDLGLTAQAVQEQADHIQALVRTNEAYRDFYTFKPTGGGYVSRTPL
ncbi:hypothetical protein GGR41_000525 [Paenalcaligenes hominis]|uniref:Uncharacterized protein n=1 Tax=Paenalcaligenes hominis TaxID=643674 RepID=A0ABX0WQ45_9BURK|nr:hypothetical protein [Paenalcaligenes hominis]NJB64304.1 hypothetical protein [Paenalcaligenes hominis]GGE68665.1 hypothetical protein GCM10007278_15950 [Paenalcaligenes hominis]